MIKSSTTQGLCRMTSKVWAMEYDRPLITEACVVSLVLSGRGHGCRGKCSG